MGTILTTLDNITWSCLHVHVDMKITQSKITFIDLVLPSHLAASLSACSARSLAHGTR